MVRLKVASTPQEQSQGYIGAKSIPMNEGILFSELPPGTGFHMRGVKCRLAIAFLDQDNRVISARTMEPEELWIPTPPGTRSAVEVHPDHLSAMQGGMMSIGGKSHTARLSNRSAATSRSTRPVDLQERCPKCGGKAYQKGYCFSCNEYWQGAKREDTERETDSVGQKLSNAWEMLHGDDEDHSGRHAQAGPWSAEKLDPDLVMEYEGYKILKSGDNFRVKDPKGYYMTSVASSVTMARKWIDWDIHENRNRRKGQAGPWNKDAKKPWSEQRAKEIEELLIDRNLTLSRALEYGLITEDEYGKWILWDYQTRLE